MGCGGSKGAATENNTEENPPAEAAPAESEAAAEVMDRAFYNLMQENEFRARDSPF